MPRTASKPTSAATSCLIVAAIATPSSILAINNAPNTYAIAFHHQAAEKGAQDMVKDAVLKWAQLHRMRKN
jgi:hypothetical protein